MEYQKRALNYEQQADLLLSRGLQGDRSLMVQRLKDVNYYRLSGYWYNLRNLPGDDFRPNQTFETVWGQYTFDRQLRLIVMDAIERTEIAFRAWLAYEHAHFLGPFAYATDRSLPQLDPQKRQEFLRKCADRQEKGAESFVTHFKQRYRDNHEFMPIWMAVELMDFGQMVTLFRGSPPQIKKAVARRLEVSDNVVWSWLLALNAVRNICAHHSRLWNRTLGVKPLIPNKQLAWHQPVEVSNSKLFGVVTILKYCLNRVAPQSRWFERLTALLCQYRAIPIRDMGFPSDWQLCPIWKPPET